jgi:hypothetical protein
MLFTAEVAIVFQRALEQLIAAVVELTIVLGRSAICSSSRGLMLCRVS